DIVDRRKLLLVGEAWGVVTALAMALVAWNGAMTPEILLALTFVLAMGAAISMPAFEAILPELVSRQHVPGAAAVNSMSTNFGRALGPVVAGLVIVQIGIGAVFLLNAISFVGMVVVLWRWRNVRRSGALPPEHFFPAMRVGWRYAARDPAFLLVLL